MHSLYVSLACAFGSSALNHASPGLFGSEILLSLCFGSALGLVLLSLGIEAVAARGRIAERVSRVLGKARFARVNAWMETRHHRFARADVQLARLSKSSRVGMSAAWRMFGLWFFEGLETYVILRLLDAPLAFLEVMSIDAALSVVRSSAMFAPAGIGIQDVGYLAMLEALGVPNASALGPAFIVVKRLKEAIWIAVGFVMLARIGPREVLKEAKEQIAKSDAPSPAPDHPTSSP
jgi:uncharacterized membrane protein YbhN (UPF0104 family)